MKEYRITDSSVISEDMMVLYTWFEYFKVHEGKPGFGAPIYVKKAGGQWKIDEPQVEESN